MADTLVWTTYVVAAVVVVAYGLAACFVAFLRCLALLQGPAAHCTLSITAVAFWVPHCATATIRKGTLSSWLLI